jgi:hypothetical protein
MEREIRQRGWRKRQSYRLRERERERELWVEMVFAWIRNDR